MSSTARDHIGPYRLLKLVRVGKTAQIWEAINSTENRRVALKALLKEYREDRAELAILKHEYSVGHQLDHECVNRVFEFNVVRGTPYLVMDFVSGANIKQWLRQSPEFLTENIDQIIREAAQGLSHMHSKGWIHRDVKPDNYLLNDEAHVKLIDFAIAQRVKKGLGRLIAGKSKVQGTRSYMSPEQIRGQLIDVQSDIYSFGCTVFELLARRLPYTGTSPDDLLNKHLRASIPTVATFNDNVTPDCAKLISQMMAKDPGQRPESMDAVLEQLDRIRILNVRPH